ncbi:MAG: response regulator, partial [Magnetococcales bacterium]|nr:response regulator [Magnetococcales bacterium]
EDIQVLIRAFLRSTPHSLAIATNGHEAVRLLQSETFDLVFMDVQMPEMDGYTATRLIRQWERDTKRSPLPIIALTAHALKEDEEKSREAGCTKHENKPINKQRLLKLVTQFGKQRSVED